MSTEPSENPEIECSVCGLVGKPPPGCGTCHGNAPIQSRAYTLTEERQGKNKDESRYGRTGDVSPKIVTFPGSANPHQG